MFRLEQSLFRLEHLRGVKLGLCELARCLPRGPDARAVAGALGLRGAWVAEADGEAARDHGRVGHWSAGEESRGEERGERGAHEANVGNSRGYASRLGLELFGPVG